MPILTVAGFDPSLQNFGMVKATIDLADPNYPVTITKMQLTETKPDGKNKTVRKNSQDLTRAKALHKAMMAFISDVNLVFVEVPVGSQSARSMASYGICLGVLAAVNKPMIQLTPYEVKLAAVGSKTASKDEMIAWAVETYPEAGWLTRKHKGEIELLGKNEHLADAIATIRAGLLTDQFEHAVGILTAA